MGLRFTTPVTVITGFLGSGKTTLVNRILRESHGQRIAVIENEFGAVGVDAEFLASGGDETIIQLANGCVCCTVRGDLAKALHELARRAAAGQFAFDRVLLETTGLADPGPVIQTFLAETEIQSHFHLDGVVTLADAVHATDALDRVENRAQLAYADRVLLSKCDLADPVQRDAVVAQIAQLNPRVDPLACDLHAQPIEELLSLLFDTRGYVLDYVPPAELARSVQRLDLLQPAADGGRLRRPGAAPHHTRDVTSCVFQSDVPLSLERLNGFLDDAIAHFGVRLWRYKGIVQVADHRPRLVLQGVQRLAQLTGGPVWRPFERRHTTLVFIGQQLDAEWLTSRLRACEQRAAAVS